ncbi:MAG TPA: NAD(P)H-binding protein, partial [Thermoguttaceae bacterium]|nr:NAD(P)H-binding protein [Thermoguttaceae bacterium]
MAIDDRLICVTGATGYIGGRLLPLLEDRAARLRCLARRPDDLRPRVAATTEIVQGDVLDRESLLSALHDVDTAYYLVHSLGTAGDFERDDREGAENFAFAAREEGVRRIVYLGGLGDPAQGLSAHLSSRQEVGRILRSTGIQVIEFRASIVIGSGSLSFELIRALVERLPVMVCPKWVSTRAQPIAVEDVLAYLLAALDLPDDASRVFEIAGPQQVSYGGIMREYARQRGLRRVMVSVPVLTPYLSSLWLSLVTPLYARTGRKLVEGLRNPTVVRDPAALQTFAIRPRRLSEAIGRALADEEQLFAETRWSDVYSAGNTSPQWDGKHFAGRVIDSRTVDVDVPPEAAFAPIQRIGGSTGWYYGKPLWKVRGCLDLLVGGVGLRPG